MTDDGNTSDHTQAISSKNEMRSMLVALGMISFFLVGEGIAAIIGPSPALFAGAGQSSR